MSQFYGTFQPSLCTFSGSVQSLQAFRRWDSPSDHQHLPAGWDNQKAWREPPERVNWGSWKLSLPSFLLSNIHCMNNKRERRIECEWRHDEKQRQWYSWQKQSHQTVRIRFFIKDIFSFCSIKNYKCITWLCLHWNCPWSPELTIAGVGAIVKGPIATYLVDRKRDTHRSLSKTVQPTPCMPHSNYMSACIGLHCDGTLKSIPQILCCQLLVKNFKNLNALRGDIIWIREFAENARATSLSTHFLNTVSLPWRVAQERLRLEARVRSLRYF